MPSTDAQLQLIEKVLREDFIPAAIAQARRSAMNDLGPLIESLVQDAIARQLPDQLAHAIARNVRLDLNVVLRRIDEPDPRVIP
jgi:ribosomal 50S subunit-associated protein YjgA (DUF615 family)